MPFRFSFVVLSLVICACGSAQPTLVESPSSEQESYSAEDYRQDVDELATRLIENHPQPYEFISESDFQQLVLNTKGRITEDTTIREFIWMFSSIIAGIGCSHTSLGYFNQEDRLLPDSQRFPLDARFINSRLYVVDPLVNGDVVSAGDEILSVNGVDARTIRSQILWHISSDAHIETFGNIMMNAYFTAYMAYHFEFSSDYSIVTTGDPAAISLKPVAEYEYKPRLSPSAPCQDRLCARVLDDATTAVATIRSSAYYGGDLAIFKAFVDSTFTSLAERGVRDLILDYRGNSGGSGGANSYLLQHIADRPFSFYAEDSAGDSELKQPQAPSDNRFVGNVFVLSDGGGQSSTGHFLSLVKSNSFATIVGEEAGATYTVNDNSARFEASNTGITYKIARTTFYTTADGLPNTIGVLPDHEVSTSIEDVLRDVDTVLNYTLALIHADGAAPEYGR